MKITLRKVKSSPIGEKYNADFFVPIHLPLYRSSVSVSVRGNAYSICKKYSIDFKDYDEADFAIYQKRKVIEVRKKISYIFVPSTHASKSSSIKKYSNQICDFVEFKDYLHFTHFGYLKAIFPFEQIKTILNIFLGKNEIECEVCWDIDEKFFNEMQELLEKCLVENNLDKKIDNYDNDSFKWSDTYDNWRANRKHLRDARRLQHNERISEAYRTAIEALDNFRRNDVVTRRPNNIMQIGTVAAGNAGEFYALQIFIRMGFVAGKAPEGTSKYDLLVMSSDAYTFKPVQVKTITNGEHWLLSIAHETVTENLVYCFVKFTDIQSLPKIFLIPADVVSDVIFMGNKIYMKLPNRFGRFRAGSDMRTLKIDFSTLLSSVAEPHTYLNEEEMFFIREHSLGWLDAYESNFDIFSTQVEQ